MKVFAYDRAAQACGIVHFGIGAFHRAHMAWYTDACMNAGEQDWMIAGISMRSAGVAEQLNPQDGLYSLTERSGGGSNSRVIGAIRRVIVATGERDAIVDRIASADCHIVSFTVTEKGYCRLPDGSLDLAAAAQGFYPIITEALSQRKAKGLPGVTLLSCDNLSHNGRTLGRLFANWLVQVAPDLADWFISECRSPNTMVDRIVPATTEADLAALASQLGLQDAGAVFTEPFSQWVIEDDFAGVRPSWENHGAQLVPDITPYETAKLRMLNGAHSLLAYCGLKSGHTYVHQAMADPALGRLVEALMREEALPTIDAGEGQDLFAYTDALLARFANPALNHRLNQIAMDGSQKLPQRWLMTLALAQRSGRNCPAILQGIAAWIDHLRGANGPVDDPLASQLAIAVSRQVPVLELFGSGGLLSSLWQPSSADIAAIIKHQS